jgi:hypothetical protein
MPNEGWEDEESELVIGQVAEIPTPSMELTVTEDLRSSETEPGDRKKVLFWNSNGWDVDKARRVAQGAQQEGVNVICIVDTKQDNISAPQKIKTLAFYLYTNTGRRWDGIYSPTIKGLKVGGTFIMVSDQMRIIKHNCLIEGGILDELVVKWGGKELKVQSIYRPVAESGKGSLRGASNKILGSDLDTCLVEKIGACLAEKNSILGGDFNLDRTSASRFLLKAGSRGGHL